MMKITYFNQDHGNLRKKRYFDYEVIPCGNRPKANYFSFITAG